MGGSPRPYLSHPQLPQDRLHQGGGIGGLVTGRQRLQLSYLVAWPQREVVKRDSMLAADATEAALTC